MSQRIRSALWVGLVWSLVIGGSAFPQSGADDVNQQAAKLEAELGKYKDTSPEAADVMVKLADLYHQHGRVFGLARVGQQFVSAHATDKRHQPMMLKLLDALDVLSRNKEFTATCRQFLTRYPQAAECADLEVRLADVLAQMDNKAATAEACVAVWNRQPTTDIGRRHGIRAIAIYSSLDANNVIKGAAFADSMLDKLPAGEFAREVGWQAVYDYRRQSQWAKSTAVALKLLQKNLVGTKAQHRELHTWIAENYANLSQNANSAEHLKKARELGDSHSLHYLQIQRLAGANAKAAELAPVVKEYAQKYPKRQERFVCLSYFAHALLRDGDKPKGLSELSMILPYDAITNSNASTYVAQNGNEPEKLKQSEETLRRALQENQAHASYLRYVLAIDLYRDRMKDNAKAKQAIRESIAQSPSDDNYTAGPIEWLLNSAETDQEFQSDVALILKARQENIHMASLRNGLTNWQRAARLKKELKDRATYVADQVNKADEQPVVALYLDSLSTNKPKQIDTIRENLRDRKLIASVNDRLARSILGGQQYTYRISPTASDRVMSVGIAAQMAARFPQDPVAAVTFLEGATDYGNPEAQRAALEHLVKLEPHSGSSDIWRRLMIAADNSKDPAVAKVAHDWIRKAQTAFGFDVTYASSIGDALMRAKMETEAVAHWTAGIGADPNHYEYSECAARLLARIKEPAERTKFLQGLLKSESDHQGRYYFWQAGDAFAAKDYAGFAKTLTEARKRLNDRPFRGHGFDSNIVGQWLDGVRANMELVDAEKLKLYTVLRELLVAPASGGASLAITELTPADKLAVTPRLLSYSAATRAVGDGANDWDRLSPFAVAALERKDYVTSATLATGLLSNVASVDEARKKTLRDVVTQSYARMGSVGLTVDENSPLAPLFQAALYLRLGDERLAFDAYAANRKLFSDHKADLPVDLVSFVCDRLIAAGGDANHDQVEEVLRGWLVKNSESKQIDEATKARVQLLLAKNFFKAQRYDVARSEYTTVVNRYPKTPHATEAEFGIGETYMAQKVYDQAEQQFEKLSRHVEIDIVVRAEFLRGVLAFRRGDRDEAREIFRAVLERVPNVELANQALYSLSEVYGAEEKYIDQLNLLRTVGRLGRNSKRKHVPGTTLSIVVHDSDLGISRGHNRIPVLVTTEPGGDRETIYLTSAGAGKGLFRVDLETRLGQAAPGNGALELTGKDMIKCDYPPEFKAEFKTVPLSDVEITMAADARFAAASAKIEEKLKKSFSEELKEEAADDAEVDQRKSQTRPDNQIKPGNVIYLQAKDADRDLTNEPDTVVVKLTADSGDQVQVRLVETGPHTGIFEASAKTGELPAGARASDTAIDHSPLMAIDHDAKTSWMSEPDGATPKWLTIDMKDLKAVGRTRVSFPNAEKNIPVRGELLGSQDGEFWFRIASHPEVPVAEPVAGEYGAMRKRVYAGAFTTYTTWSQVVALTKNSQPIEDELVTELTWQRPEDAEGKKNAAVVWHGKLVQPRDGAARIRVEGGRVGLVLDGREEMPLGNGGRTVDVYLTAGTHDLTIFAATLSLTQPVSATWARADLRTEKAALAPFRKIDFDLTSPEGQIAPKALTHANATPVELKAADAKVNKKTDLFGPRANDATTIGNWKDKADSVSWQFTPTAPVPHEIWITYAHAGVGGSFQVETANGTIAAKVPDTGAATTFRTDKVATVLVDSAAEQSLSIKAGEIVGDGLMELKGISLKPVIGTALVASENAWEMRFEPVPLRYTKFVVHEYRGEAVAINHLEIGGAKLGDVHVPTQADVLSLSNNDVLEIAGGDVVSASYTDEFTQHESGGSQLLVAKLTATYNNASVAPIAYDFLRASGGAVQTQRKDLMRVDPGERVVVEITDYDEDRTSARDTIKFQVAVNNGEPIELEAVETGNYTGIFTKEVDTQSLPKPAAPKASGSAAPVAPAKSDKLTVKAGDRIYVRYLDTHNTFPGHSVPRESVVYVNQPTEARIRVLQSRVILPKPGIKAPPQFQYSVAQLAAAEGDTKPQDEIVGVAFEAPLTVEVIDPDSAKDSRSTVTVTLTTSSGAKVEVDCVVSGAFAVAAGNNSQQAGTLHALEEGRFIGQVIMQLGGKGSADIVPVTSEMPRGLIGKAKLDDGSTNSPSEPNLVVTRVLNLSGKDVITAEYADAQRPDGKAKPLSNRARLIANGELFSTDREYDKEIHQLHVGEKLFLKVTDADRDTSDERDVVEVTVVGELGERETVPLHETLAHSGVFTGSLTLKAVDKPMPGNLNANDPAIESYFGDKLTVKYTDSSAATSESSLERTLEIPVVVGTDGLVAAFSKTFNDESLAVETKFRIAEAYFELFKSHKNLERTEEKNADLEAGKRILREVMEDYPDPKYAPRIAYLLGQFAQELGQWDEAVKSYELILRQYGDHPLAPDAQYKMAQSHEESGNFDAALEAYVTLAATHPKSPLIPNVMIRISDHFYKTEKFVIAAQVGEKFLERFEGHQHGPKMAFRVGQCYYKLKLYKKAGESFDKFGKKFPDDALAADSLFWSGESFRLGASNLEAFRRYNRCRWDYPSSEAAKYARGRLALPEMLQQFEADARSADQ